MVMTRARRPIDAAMVYARRGWPVFPCHQPAVTGSCSCRHADCGSVGKHPRIKNGLHSATSDQAQIRAWWRRWPAANVAIRTGAASGLVVLDVDPDHGGEDSLRQLESAHGPLPEGRTISTGSGGRHLYFAHPGWTLRNDAGRRLGPGLDVRGDGGYVIAPPSRHRSGASYIASGGSALPELPRWMLVALQPPEPKRLPPPRDVAVGDAWAQAALKGELLRLLAAPQGSRNDTLNRVAFRLGQIVAAGLLPEADTQLLLVDHAKAIGLGEREAVATTQSGLTAGQRAPVQRARRPGVGLSV